LGIPYDEIQLLDMKKEVTDDLLEKVNSSFTWDTLGLYEERGYFVWAANYGTKIKNASSFSLCSNEQPLSSHSGTFGTS